MLRPLTMSLILASMILLFAVPASAKKQSMQNIEFSSITCGEFVADIQNASEGDLAVVFMWLDGYLSGVSGDTTLNWDNLSAFTENLVAFCADNSGTTVLNAAKKVGLQ